MEKAHESSLSNQTATLNFDDIYLGHGTELGATHLETQKDVQLARIEEDSPLLLSNEAELFCTLIVLHGQLPSEAYMQAFTKQVDGQVIKPDMPAYLSKKLLATLEVKSRIAELRDEIVEWGKTTFEELESNLRRIALSPDVKDSDRIAASKTLAGMKGFGNVDGNQGGTLIINLPFTPNNLTPVQKGVTIDVDMGIST